MRKISELSGRLRLEAPVEQSAVPLALAVTELMTQTLVGVLPGFGIGSGGPNRHPTLVQFRLLAPGSLDLTLVRVSVVPLQADTPVSELPMSGTAYGSGTLLLPPPVKRPPQARLFSVAPALLCTVPQLPLPIPVVKVSSLGIGLKPQQPTRVVVVVVVTIVVVVVATGAVVVVVATGAVVVVVATGVVVVVVATGVVVVVVATGAVVVVVPTGAVVVVVATGAVVVVVATGAVVVVVAAGAVVVVVALGAVVVVVAAGVVVVVVAAGDVVVVEAETQGLCAQEPGPRDVPPNWLQWSGVFCPHSPWMQQATLNGGPCPCPPAFAWAAASVTTNATASIATSALRPKIPQSVFRMTSSVCTGTRPPVCPGAISSGVDA